jgi:hypothetical protein
MRHRFVVAVALIFVAGLARAQQLGPIDWIFLVDTSKSMRGVGHGSKNIFDDVKASIGAFLEASNEEDTIAVYTFSNDVELRTEFPVRGNRERLLNTINTLKAEGNRTYLGGAIAEGLGYAGKLRKKADKNRTQAVVLFTDGKEDVRGIPDPIPIPSNIPNVGDSYVFFVSMGEHEPLLDEFSQATTHTMVMRETTPQGIRRVVDRIRANIAPEPPPPPPLKISIAPQVVEFGNADTDEMTDAREITISSNRPTSVTLFLGNAHGITLASESNVAVSTKPVTVPVQLHIAEDAKPGLQQLTLGPRDAAEPAVLNVFVVPPSPLWRALKVLLALLILAGIAFYFWQQQRKKNRLEGELEILRPQTTPDAAFVGLPKLEATEVALSAILPVDALNGNDARLFVKRKDGRKKVWISATGGGLRINDVETPMSELYDADTIEIGAAKLRFNRIGDERPYAND